MGHWTVQWKNGFGEWVEQCYRDEGLARYKYGLLTNFIYRELRLDDEVIEREAA